MARDEATSNEEEARGEMAGRLPSLEEQTPGLDTDQERRTEADARAFFEGGAGASAGPGGADEEEPRSELERRSGGAAPGSQGGTPAASVGTQASLHMGGAGANQGGQVATGQVDEGQAEGHEEEEPPAGDVRAAYSSDREPGAAEPNQQR